jgi:hypothetical protein
MSLRISIHEIVHEILNDVTLQRRPLVVFDLDSTLFNVSTRTQLIVDTFVHEPAMQQRFPREVEFLKTFKTTHRDWGLRQPLERSGFLPGDEEFGKTLRDYWRARFFSSNFLHADVPYAGSIEAVNKLHDAGAVVYYLTGRDQLNMGSGTIEQLRRWSYPLRADASNLIMKPIKGSVEDEDFKEIEMKKLMSHYQHIWFFENEPVIIHRVRVSTPHVKIIWVDTTHSGRAGAPDDLPILEW